jgi:hypothetical protein
MFIFLSIATFAAVIVQDQKWLSIDPGILGLALSLLIQLAGLFQWCIRQVRCLRDQVFTCIESRIVHVFASTCCFSLLKW